MMFNEDQVRSILREKIEVLGSQKAFADQANLSCQYVNDVLLGRRGIGNAIADALGLEPVHYWQRKAEEQ